MIKYVKGDATSPVGEGNKLIIHVCNDIGAWGAGFVIALSNKWKEPEAKYRAWNKEKTNFTLGAVQFVQVADDIVVGNMIGQHHIKWNKGVPPIRYEAITKCLEKVAEFAKENGYSIHAPKFGAGLAGGDWNKIASIIEDVLDGLDVTVYEFE